MRLEERRARGGGEPSAAATPASGAIRRDPERTRRLILDAATAEFAAKGLDGARIAEIAERAGANKRMLYHYFGNKEALYLAALEATYETIRSEERRLDLENLSPVEGMTKLLQFTWKHFQEHPEFIKMLNTENLLGARYLKRSKRIAEMHSPLTEMIGDLLRRGAASGDFRPGVDPMQLYISIASLGYFYLSNRATLSTIFRRDLGARRALNARRDHIVEVILGYLRPE